MDSFLLRKPFLEETASLFADEKTTQVRNKIVEYLNESGLTSNPSVKSANIIKIQEMILHSDVDLLDEYIDDILAFSHDPNMEVRKNIAGFIEEVCSLKISFLPSLLPAFVTLLRDPSPQVVKRVIQASSSIYKNTLRWIASLSDITDDIEHAWNTLCLVKAQILDMIDNDNDGIRTNAIKFLECVVLVQTYQDAIMPKRAEDLSLDDVPLTLKLVRRRKLEDEAMHIFDLLLKFHAASHISSVNLIACTGTLCTIGKQRPTLLRPVVEALKNLHSNLPPTLTNSQVSSVRKHLKMQFLNLLKHPACHDMYLDITPILNDLGASANEIARALPKLDKSEQLRRAKRTLEQLNASTAKKPRVEKMGSIDRQMEVDEDEVLEQLRKSTKMNETFVAESLKSIDQVIHLVIEAMNELPDEAPAHFLREYKPVVDLTIQEQVQKIAENLGQQMTEQKIGPGAICITKEPPMRPRISEEEVKNIILGGARKEGDDDLEYGEDGGVDEEETFGDDSTERKLRETLERVKGQGKVSKTKRVKPQKSLKDITTPLSQSIKKQLLQQTIGRIVQNDKQAIAGGIMAKRKKILSVCASTFSVDVRDEILNHIKADLSKRLDLALCWLFEEYCLLQGFIRHPYVKTEPKSDHAYNDLLVKLLSTVLKQDDLREKRFLIERVYLESPTLTFDSLKILVELCDSVDMSHCAMNLTKQLILKLPPKQKKLLDILCRYSVHDNVILRDQAIDNIVELYSIHKVMQIEIETFAIIWMEHLEKETPSDEVFETGLGRSENASVWTEDLTKICLALVLHILPFKDSLLEKLCTVYINTSSDLKRTMLRSIESPIKKMGPSNLAILRLIEECPKGAETLITRIIYILTEKSIPSPELVEKVRQLHQTKVSDVRLLIPVLNGLAKWEILITLPKILKLNAVVVKEAFNRLLGVGQDKHIIQPITPIELLVTLHTLDNTQVDLKFIVKATSLCLAEKEVYTHEVLGVVLQQLIEITPLPTLLMRTVIQSLTLYPKLSSFIINLLQRLILKQVWKQKVVWDGFLKCCQRLQPQSLGVLIQLPVPQLQDALQLCPELKEPLLDYAKGVRVSDQIMQVLTNAYCSTDDFTLGEASSGIFPEPMYIKVEPMDMIEPTEEPLPPGME